MRQKLRTEGKFLVIEGGHGTGKTTLAHALNVSLANLGFSVLVTKEPYSQQIIPVITKYAKTDNLDPYVLQYLLLADRTLHVQFIQEQIKKFDYVISVRYVPSNLVYQRISKIPLAKIRELNSMFPEPDLMILLQTNMDRRTKRMRKHSVVRQQHHFLTKNPLTLEQKYYNELCNSLKKKHNIKVINAHNSKTSVLNEALNFIQKKSVRRP